MKKEKTAHQNSLQNQGTSWNAKKRFFQTSGWWDNYILLAMGCDVILLGMPAEQAKKSSKRL